MKLTTLNPITLDDLDWHILGELRRDARQSIRDLAKILHQRPSTVHVRIKKLVQHGVIDRFTVKLNNKAVGENFIAFVFIATEKLIDNKAFQHPAIKEVFGVTGEYDLVMKVKIIDIETFNDFLLKFRNTYHLKKTLTMVATAHIKEEL